MIDSDGFAERYRHDLSRVLSPEELEKVVEPIDLVQPGRTHEERKEGRRECSVQASFLRKLVQVRENNRQHVPSGIYNAIDELENLAGLR